LEATLDLLLTFVELGKHSLILSPKARRVDAKNLNCGK